MKSEIQRRAEKFLQDRKLFCDDLEYEDSKDIEAFYERVRTAKSLIGDLKYIRMRLSLLNKTEDYKRIAYRKEPVVAGFLGFGVGVLATWSLNIDAVEVVSVLFGAIAYFCLLLFHLKDYLLIRSERSFLDLRIAEKRERLEELGIVESQAFRLADIWTAGNNIWIFSEDEKGLCKALDIAEDWLDAFQVMKAKMKRDPFSDALFDPTSITDRLASLDSEQAKIRDGIPKRSFL